MTTFRSTAVRTFLFIVVLSCLSGCVQVPSRPYLAGPAAVPECNNAPPDALKHSISPEYHPEARYVLHYLEFDDQGWSYADARNTGERWSPGRHMDCAIKDLVSRLTGDNNRVRMFVYVHGWHHSADAEDRDVKAFRALLAKQAQQTSRQVVGFYIGWEGDSWNVPVLRNLTFWGRKNAAHHVAEGSVREFFSRVKALRDHYNRPRFAAECGNTDVEDAPKGCPIQTLMMGHSFGAWVLYSATAPYILETLAGDADLPDHERGKRPATARERGIADMIILLNPAFEGSRYEPVHRAAKRYRPGFYESPLLVSITSTADAATKTAFPIARWFNSIFQYPSTSEEESIAMKHTHGHIDRYITHTLSMESAAEPCNEHTMRQAFFNIPTGSFRLETPWTRKLCHGLIVKSLPNPDSNPYSIVWNIRTFENIIANHNDITGEPLMRFISALFGDIYLLKRIPLTSIEKPESENMVLDRCRR